MILPDEALPLLDVLAPIFTQPTCRRFVLRMAAALLATGRRTVANLLRTLGPLAGGRRADYRRVFSRAPWSGLRLGCAPAALILLRLLPEGPVTLVGDDAVDGHPGRRVHGKPAAATPSAPATPTPPGVTATGGSYGSVGWYGGVRRVEIATGTGQWYESGQGPAALRWVFVRDRTGTHRDEYFFTTGPAWRPGAIIGRHTARWNIETTFQGLRAHLGPQTTRGWSRGTVLRAAPCLLGCTRPSPCCSPPCPRPSAPGRSAGRARPG